jgi:hypothetical protein
MANENLGAARKGKNDEFYTQYHDIQKEINAYLDFNKDTFRDKVILLPCDDPEWSNFTKYFAQNFESLGLKKLISTSYAPDSKPKEVNQQLTLFEIQNPKFDKDKARANGKIYTLIRDTTGDQKVNVEDLEWEYLKGDGDFRSPEVSALRDEADIIITNPPFSLFREFLEWTVSADKKFVMLGNQNAITYKEVFRLIKGKRLWLGPSISSGDREFRVPESYPVQAAGWRIDESGAKYLKIKGIRWFTNLDHGRRHEPLTLMSQAENIKFNKKLKGLTYEKYVNYDAIEVPFTDAIPSDYTDLMGVPITFLDKYNPDQFEIVGISGDLANRMDGIAKKGTFTQGGPAFYSANGDGTYDRHYFRIVIRHRGAA